MSEANRFKYKIWDDEAKCFCSEDTIQALGLSLSVEGKITYKCLDKVLNSSVFEPAFSTGLVDKNGKEIFEGDILEIDKPHPSYKDTEKCVVKFGEHQTSSDYYASEAYGWYADNGGFDGETSLAQLRPHTVTGNMHEHPHLLKGSNEQNE